MTLHEWEEQEDRERDARLAALFHGSPPLSPSAGFVAQTMKAVREAPLTEGRHPLRRSWVLAAGSAALVAAALGALYAALGSQQLLAQTVASLAGFAAAAGMRLVQSVHASATVVDVLETMSRVIAHALFTPAAGAGVLAMAVMAAASLSTLKRILFSEGEPSSW